MNASSVFAAYSESHICRAALPRRSAVIRRVGGLRRLTHLTLDLGQIFVPVGRRAKVADVLASLGRATPERLAAGRAALLHLTWPYFIPRPGAGKSPEPGPAAVFSLDMDFVRVAASDKWRVIRVGDGLLSSDPYPDSRCRAHSSASRRAVSTR
jgi:hypothetical protein